MGVQRIGFDQVAQRLQAAGAAARPAVARAMFNVASKITQDAKDLTPVETGSLVASGSPTPPEITGAGGAGAGGGEMSASVVFTESYAVWVHERLELKHPRGGQAKFLETALLANQDLLPGEIARELDIELAKGGSPAAGGGNSGGTNTSAPGGGQ